MGIFIGVVAGVGAIIFYAMIQLATNLMLGGITGFFPPNPAGEAAAPASVLHPDFLLIPLVGVIGGLVAGILVFTLAPEAEGHGTDEAIAAFHKKDGKIRKRVPIVKALASAFTIGSGGSGGREGPTAQIAAGFGSLVGDILKLPVQDRRIAVAVGIGAGIGAIFKSPFGGALLGGEILYSGGDFEVEALLPGFIASPVGYIIFTAYAGITPIFGNFTYTFTRPENLVFYAILGLLCGLVGKLHTTAFYAAKRFFSSLRVPRVAKPIVGLALSGVIGMFFPEVLGLGYGFLEYLIDANMSLVGTNFFAIPIFAVLILVIFLKIAATALTVGSGGSAGVFAPSLVIGGFVGAAFWMVVNSLFPGMVPMPAPFVIVGMMALFAGVGRVPISVILMVSEMTGTFALLVPSMVAVVISYFITGEKYTIYRSQVPRRSESPAHRGEYNVPLLTKIFVHDAMTVGAVVLSPSDTVAKAQQLMLDKGFHSLPLVDSGKLAGLVTLDDLQRVPADKMGFTPLNEVMAKNPFTTSPDASLLDALDKMINNRIDRLLVVSKESGELMGVLTSSDLMRSYQRVAKASSAAQPT